MGSGVEFRVLGPLEVIARGVPVALGGAQQRALLAVLLLHRREAISTDRLVEELWGARPPPTATKTVQVYVSQLRKALGGGLLETHGRAYRLAADPEQVDLDRFDALAARGRRALESGDADMAARLLREALELWRGPPLADFAYESFAQAEIAKLEEARLAALEDRIEAELAMARHRDQVAELESLVGANPNRERLLAQLMLALYRCGRQADALEAYRRGRQALSDELGLEPGPELRRLEQRILDHDPELEPPRGQRAVPGVPGQPQASRGLLLIIVGAALLLVAAIAAGAVELSSGGPATIRVAPNSLAAIDPGSDRVVAAVPVGARPDGLASGFGSLWVANLDDRTISRVDPASLRTVRTITAAGAPTGIATSAGGVWVASSSPSDTNAASTSSVVVGRVTPEFDSFHTRVRIGDVVPDGPGAIAAYGNSVWVAPATGLLTRLDATTGTVTRRLDPNASPAGVAIGAGAVWLTDHEADNVIRVDPTGLLTAIPVGSAPTGIATGAGGVWVVDSLDDDVVRIDPSTRSVTATIRVGHSPNGIAVGAGSVWVANGGDGTVTRIDPVTDRIQATIEVGGSPQAITIASGRAWVTVDAQSVEPTRGGPGGGTLRIVSTVDVDFMDPALAYGPLSWQLLQATCAGLLGYPDMAGAAGAQLTPEVAQSLPARSADGKTYTFKVRPGYRFSPPSDEPVTAQTFKDSIERTLNPAMHSFLAQYLSDVVGARAYMAGNAGHIAGVVADGDTLTIRLVAPAPDFLSRLALSAFCAVPSNTPVDRNGVAAVPSAGPYYVSSYAPGHGVVLTRNPNYHGRRPHQFARIELSVGISAEREVSEVQSGTADYTSFGLNSTPSTTITEPASSRLTVRYGPRSAAAARGRQQYFVNPSLQLDYFDLNTHRGPFRDVRLRQAVNYAINRHELAALGSGYEPLPEPPTDHYLPPGMPGFGNAHVYPLSPDLAKARQLVRLVHPGDRTVVLYTCDADPCPAQAQIVKTDLGAIGLRVEVKTFPFATLASRVATPGEPFDLAYHGWIPDYDDPEAMLDEILDESSLGPTLSDPVYQRRLAAAARLTGPERYINYGALDLALARNAAPLAAFGNISTNDFFSARIGCQTYGVYGMDLAALCIRHISH